MSLVLKLIAQRISLGILLIFAVSILIFVGTQILPGDVAQSILGQSATPENLANLRKELGLNDPPLTRYFNWLGGIMVGDLGTALTSGADISEAIVSRLGNTLFLAFVAEAVSVATAIFLGLVAVLFKDRWPDKLISATTLASISLPEFFIGYLLILVFGVKLGWFLTVATVYADMSLGERLNAVCPR